MDDILIATGNDIELHWRIVHEVLDLLAEESLFCKLSKCHFEQTSITYLGIVVEVGTIRIDPTKLNGLLAWPRKLTTVKQVRTTLGIFCYDPVSSLRKRNDVQGKGWLNFSLLNLTNGVARADSENNVGGARACGSKG